MAEEAENSAVFRFGDFELRPHSRELLKGGRIVSVQPKAFDLLVYLARRHERAVNKDELLEALWPGVNVSETALTRCVMKARRAVGDDADAQSVIKTVHSHGYRFTATLVENPAGADDIDGAIAAAIPEPTPAWRRFAVPGGAVAVLATLAAIAVYLLQPAGASQTRIAVLPIVNATENADLDWTTLGLMSFVSQSIAQSASVEAVSERNVLRLAGDEPAPANGALTIDDAIVDRLRRAQGAAYIVAARLEDADGVLQLTYSVLNPRGRTTERTLIGDSPTGLARALSQNVVALLPGAGRGGGGRDYRIVSDDPFVVEAYARGRAKQIQGDAEEARNLFQVGVEHEPDNFWLRYEYALSTRMMGDLDEAATLFGDLTADAEASNDRDAARTVHNSLGVVRMRQGDLDAAETHYRKALEAIEGTDQHYAFGTLYSNLGTVAGYRNDLELKRRYLGRAAVAFADAGLETPPGYFSHNFANLELDVGNVAEAERHYGLALDSFRLVGNKRNEAVTLHNLGTLRIQQGRWSEADAFLQQGLSLREEVGDKGGQGNSFSSLADVKIMQGRYDEAEADAAAALSLARDVGERRLESRSLRLLGVANREAGDLDAATTFLDQARAIQQDRGDAPGVMFVDIEIARVEMARGAAADALGVAQDIAERARAAGIESLEGAALELAGDAARAAGDADAALTHFERALGKARANAQFVVAATLAARMGDIYLDRDDLENGSSYLGIASEYQPDIPETLKLGARYAYARGRRNDAVDLMARAKANAGQNWSQRDDELLAAYQAASDSDVAQN